MKGPRVLVTGFEPFPGAPVNPTEALIARLRADPPKIEAMSAFAAEILPVDYARAAPSLTAIGKAFRPDIAIHFGLARESQGFRLERLARNQTYARKPDNSGVVLEAGPIVAGAETFESRLPLKELFEDLGARKLPVHWSDDAGGYLCNMVMTLSLSHTLDDFRPKMSGFVHVPLVGEGMPLSEADLEAGARAIIEGSVAAYLKTAQADEGMTPEIVADLQEAARRDPAG